MRRSGQAVHKAKVPRLARWKEIAANTLVDAFRKQLGEIKRGDVRGLYPLPEEEKFLRPIRTLSTV